ncbi:MAG: hypothetical protein HZB51_09400 [Chloroflexi bacterium]|nr:hypothetical protein [Chloroflexota bacterium]
MRRGLIVLMLFVIFGGLMACAPVTAPTVAPAETEVVQTVIAVATRPPTPAATRAPSALPTNPAANAKRGGDFVEAVSADAASFHIYQTTDPASRTFQDKVYATGLWLRDPKTLQPIPGMAQSWTVSNDGRVYTFNLRQDIKWSDGTLLTAYDFEWTFMQANNAANKYPYITMFQNLASYTAKDDYVLEVTLKQAECVGMTTVDAITPLPKHIWSKYPWNDPTKNPEIMNPTVVSGSYKLKEWKQGDHATFVRNDSYYRGAPNFDSYMLRVVSNSATQLAMLKAGQLDMAPVSVTDYADAKKLDMLKEFAWDPAMPEWDYIGFNLRRPLLKDVEVRHALSYAIPRQTIADKILNGLAKPTFSTFAPSTWVFNPDVPHYDYNIETAKATLRQAGYKLDASGKLLDNTGKPWPKLKIVYNMGNKQREQIATTTQNELKKLGIDSEVSTIEFQAYLDFLHRAPFDYDLYVLGWRNAFDPYFTHQIWSEANIPTLNAGGYVNKDLEKLFEQSNRPPCDDQSRKKVFQQIQKTVSTDSPYVFLMYRTGYAFLNKRITPNDPTALGISYFPEQWYINK